MSRRRKIEIKASELACFDTLVETLRTRPEFADFDPTSLHVWAYENYEPTIRNAARAIRHFDHWLAAHRNEMFLSSYSGNRLFCKKDLAEALGITRPTLDRWIANGWLEGCTARAFSNGERCYSADAVREALEKLKLTKTALFRRTVLIKNRPLLFIETITLHTAVKTENRGRPMQFIPKIP